MRFLILLLILCPAIASPQSKAAPASYIAAFPLQANDLELTRSAEPSQYFDKIGPRAGLMGYENGEFEMWVWPWKILRRFDLQFLLGTSTEPIVARDIVRSISVTPEVTTLTFTYESFTVREHFIVPRDEPGAIILLDVHTTQPMSIIPGFIPVMQPMWPAGIGGQFSYWDDDANGYVISEGQWRAIFLCGSPAGKQMAAPPAHMFADNPLQFRIDVKPGETDKKFIPIVIAGALPDSTTGKMKFDSVKATYARLWKDADRYYREDFDYYRDLRRTTMQLLTPDKQLNLAFEWGKVALDNLLIVNPRLGKGMVAGYGLSGGGERPGFAWFFGGDAFINVLTLNSVGMFRQARDALAFTQKWQRQDNFPIRKKDPGDPPTDVGKMAHELSQSDGLCDWWNDYHYGYNHADTTPWYIVAMADYVRTSGDLDFLRQSWGSVKQAYGWCLSKDTDGDGLMDLKGAGLGALEFGKLVGIYADVYTCGVWVQAVKEMKYMAELVGDSAQARQSEAQFKKARPRLEKLFWLDREGYYSYGATEKGEQVHEKTPWAGVAMMFGLLDEDRTAKSIEAFNSADLSTDWGVRSLSEKSTLFDPANYNYGAVWPFISSFFNTAQFKHHYSLSGYQLLQSTVRHVFDHALGEVPEVFSGALNEKLAEGYHHQGFSTTGYMLPTVRGLEGLEVDGLNNHLTLRPHFPTMWGWKKEGTAWTRVSAANYTEAVGVRVGRNPVDIQFEEELHQKTSLLFVRFVNSGKDTVEVTYDHPLMVGRTIDSVTILVDGGKERPIRNPAITRTGHDSHLEPITLRIPPSSLMAQITLRFHVGFEFLLNTHPAAVGDQSEGVRIISQDSYEKTDVLLLEAPAGTEYDLLPYTDIPLLDSIKSIEGAERAGSAIRVKFDGKPDGGFVRKQVVIRMK